MPATHVKLFPVIARWSEDGTSAHIEDESADLWASLALVDNWYQPRARIPSSAWTAEWLGGTHDRPVMYRALIGLDAEPALDEARRESLVERALERMADGPPPEPEPFGHAQTGTASLTQAAARIELISHGLQAAEARLHDAARVIEDWGVARVAVTATEALAWLRALDDAMAHFWRRLPASLREQVSVEVDTMLDKPSVSAGSAEKLREQRDRDGLPYSDWSMCLISKGLMLPREELEGFRWLAGKLLHFGPLPATELRQWREGEEPRWKWRQPDDIFPGGRRTDEGRDQYKAHVAGRDVIGTFNLVTVLIELEYLTGGLARRARAESDLS